MRDGVTKFLLAIIAVALAVIAVSLGTMAVQSSNKRLAADPAFRRAVLSIINSQGLVSEDDIGQMVQDKCTIDLDLTERTGTLSC